jgi:hypothetical protein
VLLNAQELRASFDVMRACSLTCPAYLNVGRPKHLLVDVRLGDLLERRVALVDGGLVVAVGRAGRRRLAPSPRSHGVLSRGLPPLRFLSLPLIIRSLWAAPASTPPERWAGQDERAQQADEKTPTKKKEQTRPRVIHTGSS